jgi:hypothetical protein
VPITFERHEWGQHWTPIEGSTRPLIYKNRSKLTETASQALSTAPIPVGGKAVNAVIAFFMALLSFRGISTPSLPAQGEQRRSSYFNIPRGNSMPRSANPLSASHFCGTLDDNDRDHDAE